jgi:hypothetical protein
MSTETFNYNPKMANPYASNNIPQMRSGSSQAPFFFGGSQVPNDLGIIKQKNMSGGSIKKHNFTSLQKADTKQLIALPHTLPFRK